MEGDVNNGITLSDSHPPRYNLPTDNIKMSVKRAFPVEYTVHFYSKKDGTVVERFQRGKPTDR